MIIQNHFVAVLLPSALNGLFVVGVPLFVFRIQLLIYFHFRCFDFHLFYELVFPLDEVPVDRQSMAGVIFWFL